MDDSVVPPWIGNLQIGGEINQGYLAATVASKPSSKTSLDVDWLLKRNLKNHRRQSGPKKMEEK